MDKDNLASHIRPHPDFPEPGVIFRDISPLLRDHFRDTIDLLAGQFSTAEWAGIDAVVGIESRGFILASGLAYARDKGLLIVRKPGKLPPCTRCRTRWNTATTPCKWPPASTPTAC